MSLNVENTLKRLQSYLQCVDLARIPAPIQIQFTSTGTVLVRYALTMIPSAHRELDSAIAEIDAYLRRYGY